MLNHFKDLLFLESSITMILQLLFVVKMYGYGYVNICTGKFVN